MVSEEKDFLYNGQLDAFELYHIYQESTDGAASTFPSGSALPALGNAVSGATGSAISHLLFYPIDLVITRLQIQSTSRNGKNDGDKNPAADGTPHYTSVADAFRRIPANEGGLKAFYAGASYDTFKSVADSFVFFLAYTFLRQRRRAQSSHHTTIWDELGIGILAGAAAKGVTTPLQQIVTQKQTATMDASVTSSPEKRKDAPDTSIAAIARRIYEERGGIRGFWAGYAASLVLTLNPALTFLFQALFANWILSRKRKENPAAIVTFLLAAVSKSLATAVTYPFSLAKARAQANRRASSETNISKGKGPEQIEEPRIAKGARASREALRRSVFGTVFLIARVEGYGALYQGLGPQVLKGFFEHGATMAMKERILALVTKLYLLTVQAQ